jgi:type VI secretion system protein ImpJ
MYSKNKVVWSEGMFLQPQLFQQHDRHFEALLHRVSEIGSIYPWGFSQISIDDAQQRLGKVSLVDFAGVFPDGSVFSSEELSDSVVALELPSGPINEVIVLAVAERRPGVAEVETSAKPEEFARFRVDEQSIGDSNSGYAQDAELQVGKLKLRLALARDVKNAYSCLGIVRVIERAADGSLVLDPNYCAPCLEYGAAPFLVRFIDEMRGLMVQRASALSGRLSSTKGGVGEIQDFLFLQVINRFLPLLGHLSTIRRLHPEELYRILISLAGELCTFSSGNRTASEYPAYVHERLFESFQPVIVALRNSLSMVIDASVVPIPFELLKHNVRKAVVHDKSLFSSSAFYLVVNADVPAEYVRAKLPLLMKIGPVEKLKDLVNFNLPGIAVRHLPVAPQRLPFYEGFTYFELDSTGELWGLLASSGGIGLHVAGDVPNLKIELWAARK